MVLVLVIGDLHIPHRQPDLPPKLKALLVPGKIQYILSPGDLCVKETHDWLKGICTELHVTKGEFDDNPSYPESKVVQIGEFRVGLTHGHQVVPWGDLDSLAALQRQMDVDILVTGHTHQFKAYKYEDRFLINPGSATGAFSSMTADVKPSFVLMDVNGPRAVVYVYELSAGGDVKVEKIEFHKGGKP